MSAPSLFTDAELDRIRQAVTAAETQTSGEIVPYIVGRSGTYGIAVWRAASATAVLAGALALATAWAYDGWGLSWLYSAWAMALVMTLGGVVGAVLASVIDPLRRWLAGASRLNDRVHSRAAQAFVEEEVFSTRDRTGILLFVSLFEHRIEVVGDVGISEKVEADEWEAIVGLVKAGIRRGDLAGGVVEAINRCGDLLHRSGVAIRSDDTDELSDDVRVRDN